MKSYKKVRSNIQEVDIFLNKVVKDSRGYFLDVAETDNPAIKTTKHIHSVIASHKYVARGEHSHYRLEEDFYFLGGPTLCILYDDNEKSKTYKKTYCCVGGTKGRIKNSLRELPNFFIEDDKLVQIHIPKKVWHGFWPLTDKGSTLLVLGTTGYDETDFKRTKSTEIDAVNNILLKYGIK